ncbi:MAG TPA: 16S rRNA (cytosine(967)-C(5))-methyltransferase RsmB, partial [Vicinamibacterales bacterium]|nr:16S rRNA (cytosine(967)-C(5))-methyltransferase RsmB [Vicinamibacterales bacterium]
RGREEAEPTAPLDLPSALSAARRGLADERDRALAGEIATGTLRWQGAFDHLIAEYARRPLGRLDPEIVDILRMGMFQLLHLTRVPASAVVDDAVQLAKRAGKRSAAPLVNAVLRRVSRERDHLPLPPRDERQRDAALAYLAQTLSHPQWLVERWLDRYGFADAERWCRFNNSTAALTLRANRLRTTPERLGADLAAHGVASRAARFAPDALVVESGNPLATPLAGSGAFVVQDEASQLVALMTGVRPGERVFDACASPGGKTTAMAASMRDDGLIAAADVRPRRVRLLAETVRRSGASIIRVVHADAAAPPPFRQPFDCVLLDAPCSGLGTVRRDPDIKWRRRQEDLARSADLQTRMLAALADLVRLGGRLVYATCSSEPEENEAVVNRFLEARPDFTVRPPGSLPDAVRPLLDDDGCLRTSPARDGLEAFFAAPLVKAAPVR